MSESPNNPESTFDKQAVYNRIDDAVGEMYDLYGDDVPEEIVTRGEEIRSTASAVSRQSGVSSRETFIEALVFKKDGGTLSEEDYTFIVEHM